MFIGTIFDFKYKCQSLFTEIARQDEVVAKFLLQKSSLMRILPSSESEDVRIQHEI